MSSKKYYRVIPVFKTPSNAYLDAKYESFMGKYESSIREKSLTLQSMYSSYVITDAFVKTLDIDGLTKKDREKAFNDYLIMNLLNYTEYALGGEVK